MTMSRDDAMELLEEMRRQSDYMEGRERTLIPHEDEEELSPEA